MAAGRPRLDVLAVIAAGGVIGASARFGLAEAIPTPDNGFPVATFVANVVGSFVLGLFAVASADLWRSGRYLHPFFAVGVIGSFTTFSAFAVENVLLVDRGKILVALLYTTTMLLAGVGAARLGLDVARRYGRRSVLE